MASVDTTVQGIIDNAKSTADKQILEMNSKIDAAVNYAGAFSIISGDDIADLSPSAPTELSLTPPSLTLEDLVNLDNPKALEIKEDIDREFQGFLNDYYPDFSGLAGKTVDWIMDTIDSGGKALPGDEEGKIWDRARAREDTLNEKTQHEAEDAMARRGWAAPPGLLAERLRVAQTENTLRQSTLSRDIAIKQAELAHEMLKFAISQAVQLQQAALNAAAQFVSEYVRASALGLDYSSSLANAAVNLYNQTISYYRAYFEQEDLKLRYAQSVSEVDAEQVKVDLESTAQRARRRAETAIEGARALGDSAAAALGAQNTMAATVQEITQEED